MNQYFANEANEVHSDKYDYSKVNYTNKDLNVTIICPKHGEFEQIASNHKKGRGCPGCAEKGSKWYTNKANWDKPSSCYLLHITGIGEEFWKVGITTDMDRRLTMIKRESGYNVRVQDLIKATAYDCYYNLEQPKLKSIKSQGSQYVPKIRFGGYTECFTADTNTKLKFN